MCLTRLCMGAGILDPLDDRSIVLEHLACRQRALATPHSGVIVRFAHQLAQPVTLTHAFGQRAQLSITTGQSNFTLPLSSPCDGALILMRCVPGYRFPGEQVFSERRVDEVLDVTVDNYSTVDTDGIAVLVGDADVLRAEQVGDTLPSRCHVRGVRRDHVLAQLANGQSDVDSASDC